jgi:hypothetical protein
MSADDRFQVRVEEVQLFERDVVFRMPFRFGVVTLEAAPQAFARVRIRTAAGKEAWGAAAEIMAPKWFDKNIELTNEENFEQLRQALRTARTLYLEQRDVATPFALHARTHDEQVRRCAEAGLNALIAQYGPALIDRAVIDAACRGAGLSFYAAMQANLCAIAPDELAPDLVGFDADAFLAGLAPSDHIHARHTVGLVDPLTAADIAPGKRVGDGLPETLEEVIDTYGHRYFKLKVGGDLAADLERLAAIAGGHRRPLRQLLRDPRRQRTVPRSGRNLRAVGGHRRAPEAGATAPLGAVHRTADRAQPGSRSRRAGPGRPPAGHHR